MQFLMNGADVSRFVQRGTPTYTWELTDSGAIGSASIACVKRSGDLFCPRVGMDLDIRLDYPSDNSFLFRGVIQTVEAEVFGHDESGNPSISYTIQAKDRTVLLEQGQISAGAVNFGLSTRVASIVSDVFYVANDTVGDRITRLAATAGLSVQVLQNKSLTAFSVVPAGNFKDTMNAYALEADAIVNQLPDSTLVVAGLNYYLTRPVNPIFDVTEDSFNVESWTASEDYTKTYGIAAVEGSWQSRGVFNSAAELIAGNQSFVNRQRVRNVSVVNQVYQRRNVSPVVTCLPFGGSATALSTSGAVQRYNDSYAKLVALPGFAPSGPVQALFNNLIAGGVYDGYLVPSGYTDLLGPTNYSTFNTGDEAIAALPSMFGLDIVPPGASLPYNFLRPSDIPNGFNVSPLAGSLYWESLRNYNIDEDFGIPMIGGAIPAQANGAAFVINARLKAAALLWSGHKFGLKLEVTYFDGIPKIGDRVFINLPSINLVNTYLNVTRVEMLATGPGTGNDQFGTRRIKHRVTLSLIPYATNVPGFSTTGGTGAATVDPDKEGPAVNDTPPPPVLTAGSATSSVFSGTAQPALTVPTYNSYGGIQDQDESVPVQLIEYQKTDAVNPNNPSAVWVPAGQTLLPRLTPFKSVSGAPTGPSNPWVTESSNWSVSYAGPQVSVRGRSRTQRGVYSDYSNIVSYTVPTPPPPPPPSGPTHFKVITLDIDYAAYSALLWNNTGGPQPPYTFGNIRGSSYSDVTNTTFSAATKQFTDWLNWLPVFGPSAQSLISTATSGLIPDVSGSSAFISNGSGTNPGGFGDTQIAWTQNQSFFVKDGFVDNSSNIISGLTINSPWSLSTSFLIYQDTGVPSSTATRGIYNVTYGNYAPFGKDQLTASLVASGQSVTGKPIQTFALSPVQLLLIFTR